MGCMKLITDTRKGGEVFVVRFRVEVVTTESQRRSYRETNCAQYFTAIRCWATFSVALSAMHLRDRVDSLFEGNSNFNFHESKQEETQTLPPARISEIYRCEIDTC
jgi:hypothetical protein